jgi:hypothetical protein
MRRSERALTDKQDLFDILTEATVCRLALADTPCPYIVPLNFGFDWVDTPLLYFHCANAGRKLELLAKSPLVGFELDVGHRLIEAASPCNWSMRYKSIIGRGTVGKIEDDGERLYGLCRIMAHYGFIGTPDFDALELRRTVVLRMVVEEMTGKQKR